MMGLLDNLYYYDEKGKIDDFIELTYDCFMTCSYIIGKNFTKNIEKLQISYIDDITFELSVDEGTILDMNYHNCDFQNNIVKYQNYENMNCNEKINKIQELIREKKPVFVQTITPKLFFTKEYIEGYMTEKFTPGHCFLIVGETDDDWIYVEDPIYQINHNNCIHYNNRMDMGLISKKNIYSIFLECLEIKTVSFDWENEKYIKKKICQVLLDFIMKSNGNICRDSKLKNIYEGKQAIEKLIELCDNNSIDLTNKVVNCDYLTLYQMFHWKIGTIYKRCKLLEKALEKYNFENEIRNGVTQIGCDFFELKQKLIKNDLLGQRELGKEYIKILSQILLHENQLYELIMEKTCL